MKRSFIWSLVAVAALALAGTGCVHPARSSNWAAPTGRTVALAVTVDGGSEPTTGQWAALVKAIEPQLNARGWVLVTDYAAADSILRVDFSPNPNDPENSGRAVTLSFRQNPLRSLAANARSNASAFSYTNAGFSSSNNFFGYDRYDRFYDDYYTYYPPTRNTPPPGTKPTHAGHRRDDDCPPGERHTPPRYAGGDHSSSPSSPPADYGRSRSETSYRSDTSYSRSEPSYTSYHSTSDSSSSSSSSSSNFSSSSSSGGDGGNNSSTVIANAHQN